MNHSPLSEKPKAASLWRCGLPLMTPHQRIIFTVFCLMEIYKAEEFLRWVTTWQDQGFIYPKTAAIDSEFINKTRNTEDPIYCGAGVYIKEAIRHIINVVFQSQLTEKEKFQYTTSALEEIAIATLVIPIEHMDFAKLAWRAIKLTNDEDNDRNRQYQQMA